MMISFASNTTVNHIMERSILTQVRWTLHCPLLLLYKVHCYSLKITAGGKTACDSQSTERTTMWAG